MGADEVAAKTARGAADCGVERGMGGRVGGPPVARGEERVDVPVGDERFGLGSVAVRERHRLLGPSRRDSRSLATARSARWIRTRTAPSDLPRTAAISDVDISS